MSHAARFDEFRRAGWCDRPPRAFRGGWVVLAILGFIAWWPIGLAILGYSLWSRKMGCWMGGGRWRHKMARMEERMEQFCRARNGHVMGGGMGGGTSGNRAFDEYRAETLRRLEEEEREFHDFLDRLRFAKDKAEFDQFMAERRSRPTPPQSPPDPQQDRPV
ncbi:DUF2852 domain-containing protein [Azospirillum thermophilum]|uniref:DUF2852 domain-containing protein n=1 Tax=Azospirillum thermophilum TaxID=2202148 RepID=A0A2S2CZ57_9PROT|nr:DUF2852 domain-containing protein [Azospirillum thermophilum]AWK89759.1 hypothetical protein DEW08_27700 [Azospirillum thermophilum]